MIDARKTPGDRLEEFAVRLDRRPVLVVAALALIYVAQIAPSVQRHLTFDELHTFYIAQASSVRQFVDEIRGLDLNPPLSYLLVRASMKVAGATELGARLPSILGYFAASMGIFVFIARRAGALWGAAGAALWWYSLTFFYATEARPYGLLLGFLGILLVCWDKAADAKTGGLARKLAVGGIAVGAAGMLLDHIYAPLWVAPFWAAELVRQWRRRSIDWAVWAALVLPMVACLTYLPLVHNVNQVVFPPDFQASPRKALVFYVQIFVTVLFPVAGAALVAFAIAIVRRAGSPAPAGSGDATGFRDHELVLLIVSLVPAGVLNAFLMLKHVAFYGRHAIPTFMMAYILLVLFIAYESRVNRLSGLAAALVILGFTWIPKAEALVPRPAAAAVEKEVPYYAIHPELPFVTNSALTFLEMDRYENPALVSRLYFLVDLESALKYDHTNLTEGMPEVKRSFPVRGNVSRYADFAAAHRHFLVWGVMDQTGWLLRKLKTEGAHITEIGKFHTPYADSELYEVWLDR